MLILLIIASILCIISTLSLHISIKSSRSRINEIQKELDEALSYLNENVDQNKNLCDVIGAYVDQNKQLSEDVSDAFNSQPIIKLIEENNTLKVKCERLRCDYHRINKAYNNLFTAKVN